MGLEDLYASQPLPALGPESLGVGPPPVAPLPPTPSVPIMQQPGPRSLRLGALAALLTGGANLAPLGHMVARTQDQQEAQRLQQDRLAQADFQWATRQYQHDQDAYQAQVQGRQRVVQDAVRSLQQAVASNALSPDEYDAAVTQMAALLQQGGIRVTPNFFRQAVQYRTPDERVAMRARLDQAIQHSGGLDKVSPSAVFLYRAPNGTTRRMTFQEAIIETDYPILLGPDGTFQRLSEKPLTPTEKAGKAGELAEIRQALIAGGAVEDAALDAAVREAYDRREVARKVAAARAEQSADPDAPLKRQLLQAQVEKARADASTAQAKTVPAPSVGDAYQTERTTRLRDTVTALLPAVSRKTVGIGALLDQIPESAARAFAARVKELQANIAFNELAEMRAASKTGGALGNVSERELGLLTSALGSLDTRQSPTQFRAALQRILASLDRWDREKRRAARRPAASHEDTAAPTRPYDQVLEDRLRGR